MQENPLLPHTTPCPSDTLLYFSLYHPQLICISWDAPRSVFLHIHTYHSPLSLSPSTTSLVALYPLLHTPVLLPLSLTIPGVSVSSEWENPVELLPGWSCPLFLLLTEKKKRLRYAKTPFRWFPGDERLHRDIRLDSCGTPNHSFSTYLQALTFRKNRGIH